MGKQARREAAAAGVMSPHEAAWLAWYMCAISFAFTALGLVLVALSRAHYPGVPVFELWVEDAVVAVSFSTVGAVVAPRFPPRNPIGWLFCSIGRVAAGRRDVRLDLLVALGPARGPLRVPGVAVPRR
jgi:hypothetical protein